MSYEGYEEFLCERGHYWTVDALTLMNTYGEERKEMYTCPHCTRPATLTCSVDETNGFSEDDPTTYQGKKNIVGFDDEPAEDHRGNKYVNQVNRYEPDMTSGRWTVIPEGE